MSSEWRPDDSLSERDQKGELKGARKVNAALKKNKVRVGKGVLTSRDTGMAAVRRDLKRSGLPRGVEQWQVPIIFGQGGDITVFISRLKPGTVVPEHAHKFAVFRVILAGSLKYRGKTLKAGDWMFVPPREIYSIQSGPTGCSICYAHIPMPWPPGPPPGPGEPPGP